MRCFAKSLTITINMPYNMAFSHATTNIMDLPHTLPPAPRASYKFSYKEFPAFLLRALKFPCTRTDSSSNPAYFHANSALFSFPCKFLCKCVNPRSNHLVRYRFSYKLCLNFLRCEFPCHRSSPTSPSLMFRELSRCMSSNKCIPYL